MVGDIRSFNLKEINNENEVLILSIFENKLYSKGTNIRKIYAYFFVQVKEIFQRYKAEWGALEKVKLTFFSDRGKVFIKAELFLEDFNLYHTVGNSIELP